MDWERNDDKLFLVGSNKRIEYDKKSIEIHLEKLKNYKKNVKGISKDFFDTSIKMLERGMHLLNGK